MPSKPVIFLAFSNDPDRYLFSLDKEEYQLYKIFHKLEDDGHIHIHREQRATPDKLIEGIHRFGDRLVLFHYGGHASTEEIFLENQTSANAEGLASLLGKLSNLKLVFLNGCATSGQVNSLLSFGVPNVIATSTAIEDQKAAQFAYFFYLKLALRTDLQSSFEFACDTLLLKHKQWTPAKIYSISDARGMGRNSSKTSFPWGLYHEEIARESLTWRLPVGSIVVDTIQDFQANDTMFEIPFAMAEHNERLMDSIEQIREEGNDRELFDLVIKNFPWNIGAQISRLLSEEETMNLFQFSRLEQIVSIYLAMGQFLYYVALSEWWDKNMELPNAKISSDIFSIEDLSQTQFFFTNYYGKTYRLLSELKQKGHTPFIEELGVFLEKFHPSGELYESYLCLEGFRQTVPFGNIEGASNQIGLDCIQAEKALSKILKFFSFLVNYKMLNVREIGLQNPRNAPLRYRHQLGFLNAHGKQTVKLTRQPRVLKSFLANNSIVLVKELNEEPNYLNLSPFFMDKNSYLKSISKDASIIDLYTFCFVNEDSDGKRVYSYMKSSENIFRSIQKGKFLSTSEKDKKRSKIPLDFLGEDGQKDNYPFQSLQLQFDHFLNESEG